MNLFLAGGISGNLSASWKRLAHDIERCEFTLQERTEKAESCAKFLGGTMNLYLAREHPVKNGSCSIIGGRAVVSLKAISIAEVINIFQSSYLT